MCIAHRLLLSTSEISDVTASMPSLGYFAVQHHVAPPRKAYSLTSSAFIAFGALYPFSLFKPVFRDSHNITNCTVGSDVTVTGTGDRVGGIASECRGTILYSSSAATVTGKNFVGGVVGYAGGNAEKIWYCHNDGTVKGETSVGGVLGYGEGKNDSPICYIYNTGAVSGDMDVAGLVGTACTKYKSPKYSYNIGNVAYNDGSKAPQLMNYTDDFATKRCLFYLEGTLPFSKSKKGNKQLHSSPTN